MNVCAPFLTVSRMADEGLFDRHFTTVYRWRKNGVLPEPDLVIGSVELWSEATILGWADSRNLVVNAEALDRIRATQVP